MSDEWIIQVDGKDYGPAELDALQEWKREGRVLAQNPARRSDEDLWITAAEIPGLFDTVAADVDRGSPDTPGSIDPEPQPAAMPTTPPRHSFAQILVATFRIYCKGFVQFFYLTLLVTLPWICGQLSAFAVDTSTTATPDLRSAAAAAFTLCMLLLGLVAWPVFVAGIQILTAELAAGRDARISGLLHEILRFWPRVAILCIFVYVVFFLLIMFAVGILAMIVVGASSLLVVPISLGLLGLQVWLFGRFYINVLFWQQFAVLADSDPGTALRQSKEFARSRRDLPWYQRPMWRGVFIASLWIAFVVALNIGPEWAFIRQYYHALTTSTDPQVVLEALRANPPSVQFNFTILGLGLVQKLLTPLLGIAFVLLYLDGGNTGEP